MMNLIDVSTALSPTIYFPYFRLSEDLDFVINHNWGRTSRKTLLKMYENRFKEELGILWIQLEDKRKVDNYNIAMWTFSYNSIINKRLQTIKIDLSLKNNLQLNCVLWNIQSIFKDPVLEDPIFSIHTINCIDLKESVAEKLRASLTRKIPAIRDFFDIWYIKNTSDFNFECQDFINLLNIKLQEVNFNYSFEEEKDSIIKQIETDLKPVLNEDFKFDFEKIYDFILTFKK